MNINNIHFLALRNGEFIQFISNILEIVLAYDPVELKVESQYNQLKQLLDETETQFRTKRRSRITDELKALDVRRDAAINGLSALLNGYRLSADEAVSNHARLLTDNLALHGHSIARKNYQGETAELTKIIDDWTQKPELNTAVATLNLGNWLAELSTSNTAFEERFLTRVEEKASKPPGSVKAKRAEALTAYYSLRERLDACYIFNEGAEPFASTINTINALVDSFNMLLANRKGKNGK